MRGWNLSLCRMCKRKFSRSMLTRFVLFFFIITLSNQTEKLFGQDERAKQTESKKAEPVENPFPNRHPAAELDGGVEWLNSSRPISLKELRGKIVLIDFWTFCCINCMHVLPDLAYLEKKYPNELIVIGVHSAKFDNEKESGNIRKAILRYEIAHPVVNDANMLLWHKYGVNSWPSLVMLDPEGQYCGYIAGEGNREILEKVIDRLIAYHKAKGTLDETPVRFDLERNKSKATPLRFPGKIQADDAGGRLFISDSNNNRIVVCGFDGKLIDVIGTGAIGQKDGGFAEAEFDHPQGMTLVGETLYVADTENHLLRSIDLVQKSVSTFAGTGEQNRTHARGGALRETALNSPWDLTVVDGVLYIAMAGPHQIWAHKFGTETIWQYAGSGREDVLNGDLDQAALAQPSGIVNDGKQLYVVDSEGSAVRKISTDPENDLENPKGKVTTVAGTHDLPKGRSLFEFGIVDKVGDDARFQHPLGLVYHDRSLFVADSYNHKIRRVDLKTRRVTTWAGTGKSTKDDENFEGHDRSNVSTGAGSDKPGTELHSLHLAEPAGIAISGGMMYVTDTNHHRIVAIDLKTKKAHELVIAGLTPPNRSEASQEAQAADGAKPVEVDRQELKSGNGVRVQVEFTLPEGYKLNPLLPVSYRLKCDGEQSLIAAEHLNVKQEANTDGTTSTVTIPTATKSGEAILLLSVTYGYCRDGNGGVCKVGTSHWKIPVSLSETAKATSVKLPVKAK